MAVVRSTDLTQAVVAMLRSYHPSPVGAGGVPSGGDVGTRTRAGYVVVNPENMRGLGEGFLGEPGTIVTWSARLIGVGISLEHAENARDIAVGIVADRDPADNDYLYPLAVAGLLVQTRKSAGGAGSIREGATYNAHGLVEIVASIVS